MSLKLFTSNMLETLAERLAEVLSVPLKSALDEEIILVQSRGMERWISMELARRQGICANCRFPFPNVFIHEMFRTVIPDVLEHSLFDPEVMTWRIMQILAGISKFVEVNLFLMNPCKEYWGDILSDREMKKTKDRQKNGQLTAEELYLEK